MTGSLSCGAVFCERYANSKLSPKIYRTQGVHYKALMQGVKSRCQKITPGTAPNQENGGKTYYTT